MNFQYQQSTGKISLINDDGSEQLFGTGWAGHSEGKNNPAMQCVKNTGPLPCGWYTIGQPYDNPHTGVYTMDLTPDSENDMCGRSLFRIHGAAFTNPEMSSDGCIIQIRMVREKIHNSGVTRLQVVT